MRAFVWTLIGLFVSVYFVIINSHRFPEFGETLLQNWPFISIVAGLLILFRRKGRPRPDFFFNNREIEKRVEELQRKSK